MKIALKPFILTIFMMPAALPALTQEKISVEEYIITYKETAIDKMRTYGIPASVTLAQGILESGSGNSELARKANNHFGIKCHKEWTGKTYHMDDDARDECFRNYSSPDESYRDHSLFLTSRDRYADLFKLDVTDYKGWAHGLKKAGYATNPRYPQLLIKIIEENMLFEFDRGITPAYLTNIEPQEQYSAPGHGQASFEPAPADFELAEIWETGRKVYLNNGAKFIFAEEGDSFNTIAADFEIYSWQLPKYNELDKNAILEPGQMIYLEKKKRLNKEKDTHTVRSGETMHHIAQLYGMQLRQLYKKNDMPEGVNADTGTVLRLK